MNNKLSWMGTIASLAMLTVGCGYSCEDLCSDAKDQGCGVSSCETDCEKGEELAEDADCQDEWDELMSCASDNADDACNQAELCLTETDGFADCTATYCQHNPSLCI